MFREALAARGIEELSQTLVTDIDPATRTAHLASGGTLPYDLFIGIPIHRAPDPLTASGLAVNGWVPVDQTNLTTQFDQIYAIGDVCSGPRTVPKAGIFAESAALVVADAIAASIAGGESPAPYRGWGICYAEFGDGLVSKVEVDFLSGPEPAAKRRVAGVRRRQAGVRRGQAGAVVRALIVVCAGPTRLAASRSAARRLVRGSDGGARVQPGRP